MCESEEDLANVPHLNTLGGSSLHVSVIIPAYNAEACIQRAVSSVLNQTIRPAEVLVVDDGSTDGTADRIRQCCEGVKYFHQENCGPSGTRNRGIDESTAEWVAFIDTDDEWLPHFLETHEQLLRKYPGSMWSFCNFERAGDGVPCKGHVQERVSVREGMIHYFQARLRRVSLQTSGFLVHRSVFEKVGKFKPHLRWSEDLDLWARIAMRYPTVAYSPTVCYRYWRDNPQSLTRLEYSRDPVVEGILENVELARSLGEDVFAAYYPYARRLIMNIVFLAASGKAQADWRVLSQAMAVLPLTVRERFWKGILSLLPGSIARKVVAHLVD